MSLTYAGDTPRTAKKGRKPTKTLAERFWSRVDTSAGPDACWLWTGGTCDGSGYGQTTGSAYAHRKAWELTNGRKPHRSEHVLHARGCKSKLCCNPKHLRIGDQQDNVDDAKAEGRITGRRLGSDAAILIVELRRENVKLWTYKALSKRFGFSHQCIFNVCTGKTYAHITLIPPKAAQRKAYLQAEAVA